MEISFNILLGWKMTFDGKQTSMEDNIQWRQSSMEDNLPLETTFHSILPLLEDYF